MKGSCNSAAVHSRQSVVASHLARPAHTAYTAHGDSSLRLEISKGVAVSREEERLAVSQFLTPMERDIEMRRYTARLRSRCRFEIPSSSYPT